MVAGVTERAVRLDPALDEAQVTVAMTRLDAVWEQLFPAEQQRIVRLLIEKVIVSPTISRCGSGRMGSRCWRWSCSRSLLRKPLRRPWRERDPH